MRKKRVVVLSGAGISAESGIKTFRDSGGLWEDYSIEEVATPQGWIKNPKLVLKFYNDRRRQLKSAKPNDAHKILAKLEKLYEVNIITQNVDNLHERAGSSSVLHLHGELTKVRSTHLSKVVYDIGYKDVNIGDKCELGYQLRPHIVWFGEDVPNMHKACNIVADADILIVIGTSLCVYPAASLINFTQAPTYLIDPDEISKQLRENIILIKEKASVGMKILSSKLSA